MPTYLSVMGGIGCCCCFEGLPCVHIDVLIWFRDVNVTVALSTAHSYDYFPVILASCLLSYTIHTYTHFVSSCLLTAHQHFIRRYCLLQTINFFRGTYVYNTAAAYQVDFWVQSHLNSLDTILPAGDGGALKNHLVPLYLKRNDLLFQICIHTLHYLRDSCRQLKEIYCVTTLLPSPITLIYFPWGVSNCQACLFIYQRSCQRVCSSSTSVNCLNAKERLPQHFLSWVLSSYCLFGPQMATPTSFYPLPGRP